MNQLEMVFLMKVSLHLDTMKDVIEFEKINKKCTIAIGSLKVNPWFTNKEDIEKFYTIFKQTTCNCNGFKIDDSVLLKAERIRNYSYEEFFTEDLYEILKERMKRNDKETQIKIISKVESINIKNLGEEEIEILVQNMKPNLKIECDEYHFIQFENTFKKNKIEMNYYPKQIIINMKWDSDITNLVTESNKDIIICIWKKNWFEDQTLECKNISSKVKNYITFVDLELLENNKNVIFIPTNGKRTLIPLALDDIIIEAKRRTCFDLINKTCPTSISFFENFVSPPLNFEKIKLPECVKEIVIDLRPNIVDLPFSLEGIEILNQDGSIFFVEKNDLKVIKLQEVKGMNYYGEKGPNHKQKWGNENTIDYFQKLTKLYMINCKNIELLSKLQNLEYLNLISCELCDFNIDSKKLKEIYFDSNNSTIKLKIYRNDIKFIISNCSFVDIEIECEEGIKPNIEIKKCNKLKIKSNNEMGNIIIEESSSISFNEGFKCDLIQLTNSKLEKGLIEAKVVRLLHVLKKCPINLNKANEISIVNMNNFILEGMFENCKKLIIDDCNDCDFDLGNNQIEEMKVMTCKSTNIEGTLPNIKSFISIENTGCKIPITNNVITTDEEIIELKEKMKIVTDKKHLIIRNGKDVKCEIESLIKSDITFENCHNINPTFKNEFIGILEFNNCDSFILKTNFFGCKSYGCVDSLIVNNSKNLEINVKSINKVLRIRESDLYLICEQDFVTTHPNIEIVEIENSKMKLKKDISSNKCVIINSKTNLNRIAKNCKEELVLKKIEGKYFQLDDPKKITFEECTELNCYSDLRKKEVKLIRCSDIKLKDTTNSIQMESCQNIEVDTEESQSSESSFSESFFTESSFSESSSSY